MQTKQNWTGPEAPWLASAANETESQVSTSTEYKYRGGQRKALVKQILEYYTLIGG